MTTVLQDLRFALRQMRRSSRLADESAESGWLSPELLTGIRRVKGVKCFGQMRAMVCAGKGFRSSSVIRGETGSSN